MARLSEKNVIVTDFAHLFHCFCEILLQQKENNAIVVFYSEAFWFLEQGVHL